MKRFYSHYSFIYPDVYLKNSLVELGPNNELVRSFPFEKEVSNTEFYAGLLLFIPSNIDLPNELLYNDIILYETIGVVVYGKRESYRVYTLSEENTPILFF